MKGETMTEAANRTTAPLKNVKLFSQMLQQLADRDPNLPGIGVFYGYSGYGKSMAAVYATNKLDAAYVEVGYSWTSRILTNSLLDELSIAPASTVAEGVQIIIETLQEDPRPLIIDEADHLLKKQTIEIIREIHDKAFVPVALIGEEKMPTKLLKWERFHNRVLKWQPAQKADMADTRHLARLYCPEISIGEDLLAEIHEASEGKARRICVNLAAIKEQARTQGLQRLGKDEWGDRKLYTGTPPARRAA